MSSGLRVERRSFGDPVVQGLVAELQQEFVQRYGGPDETHLDVPMFERPAGAFFVGFAGEEPVAMGGWRFRPDVQALGGEVAAEIKRMWVDGSWRGVGLGRRMLAALEREAGRLGYRTVVLDTNATLTEAITMYESAGYEPTGRYNDNPYAQRWFRKPLPNA